MFSDESKLSSMEQDQQLFNIQVSIIVAIYNVEPYLERCIRAIQCQTYKNLQIILVDDGSSDGCSEICDSFARLDSRITVIHKKNEGLVSARKTGLDIAGGGYIAFVDGDDWMEADMYASLLEAAVASGADFVESGWYMDYPDMSLVQSLQRRQLKLGIQEKELVIESWLKGQDFFFHQTIWSKLYRRDIIIASYGQVPDDMSFGEDQIAFMYLISNARNAFVLDGCYYHYVIRKNSLTHQTDALFHDFKLVTKLQVYKTDIVAKLFPSLYSASEKTLFDTCGSRILSLLADKSCTIRYLFPAVHKLAGKKVAIYGAGKVGQSYIYHLSRYENIDIVCWVDKNNKNYAFDYRAVEPVQALHEKNYDVIIVAVLKESRAGEIKSELINGEGVEAGKILWIQPEDCFVV